MGSVLKSWMRELSVVVLVDATSEGAAEVTVALGLGVAGSGLAGSPSGMETKPLFSCESLL